MNSACGALWYTFELTDFAVLLFIGKKVSTGSFLSVCFFKKLFNGSIDFSPVLQQPMNGRFQNKIYSRYFMVWDLYFLMLYKIFSITYFAVSF